MPDVFAPAASVNINDEGGPVMGLEGPSREIKVEPVRLPEPAREAPTPEPVKAPEKVPA